MTSVREAVVSTVDRHYTIAGILIAAGIALVVGVVIGMLVAGSGAIPGTSALSFLGGGTSSAAELRQGGR